MRKSIGIAAAAVGLALAFPAPAQAATVQTGGAPWAAAIRQHSVTRVNGKLHIPSVSAACGSSSMAAAWVGIGGYGTSQLAQLGVTLYPGGTVGAWYEVDAADGSYLEHTVPMTIHPGDYVQFSMAFLNNHTEVEFKWWDTTNGALHYVTLPNAGQWYSNTTPEWVVERVEGYPVAAFGTIHWYKAWFGTPDTASAAAPLSVNQTLIDPSDYSLVTAAAVSSEDLDFSWHRCT